MYVFVQIYLSWLCGFLNSNSKNMSKTSTVIERREIIFKKDLTTLCSIKQLDSEGMFEILFMTIGSKQKTA